MFKVMRDDDAWYYYNNECRWATKAEAEFAMKGIEARNPFLAGKLTVVDSPVTIWEIRVLAGFTYFPTIATNYYHEKPQHAGNWNENIESGKNYMVGRETPMSKFLADYRRPMSRWQKLAYAWAIENPDKMLILENDRYCWQVYKRGDFVEFGLPHHGKGGEKHWMSRTGKTMI